MTSSYNILSFHFSLLSDCKEELVMAKNSTYQVQNSSSPENEKQKKKKHDLLSEDTKPYYYLTPSNMDPPQYERERQEQESLRNDIRRNSEGRWQRWRRSLMGPEIPETDERYFEIGGSNESINSTDAPNAQLTQSDERLKFTQKSYLALAIISTVFFNIPIGIIAIVCSLKAAKFYQKGDKAKARKLANCSVVLSLVAMVITVTVVLVVVVYVSAAKVAAK